MALSACGILIVFIYCPYTALQWSHQLLQLCYSAAIVILDAKAILHYLNMSNLFIKMILVSRYVAENIQEVVYFKEAFT